MVYFLFPEYLLHVPVSFHVLSFLGEKWTLKIISCNNSGFCYFLTRICWCFCWWRSKRLLIALAQIAKCLTYCFSSWYLCSVLLTSTADFFFFTWPSEDLPCTCVAQGYGKSLYLTLRSLFLKLPCAWDFPLKFLNFLSAAGSVLWHIKPVMLQLCAVWTWLYDIAFRGYILTHNWWIL